MSKKFASDENGSHGENCRTDEDRTCIWLIYYVPLVREYPFMMEKSAKCRSA